MNFMIPMQQSSFIAYSQQYKVLQSSIPHHVIDMLQLSTGNVIVRGFNNFTDTTITISLISDIHTENRIKFEIKNQSQN
ncbi:hypothetical protein C1H46_013441 [Malus baccata]|uniref:Uncharacterized protein n=1 Tax=Malus baccata TaxID=106549 RepID=A0A540MQ32_MALBA|nr:hypothetical protein C1H46_013441 [Malus baccata]